MKLKRTIAGIVSAVMGLSSLGLSVLAPASVSAADPWEGGTETSILQAQVSSDEIEPDGNSWGYIQSNQDSNIPEGEYLKITYTVDGDVENDTNIFNLQPFDTAWGGWNDNFVTVGDSSYDTATETYTAYISTESIKSSLGEGKTLKGINISFAGDISPYDANGDIVNPDVPVVTLTGYWDVKLSTGETGGEITPDNPLTLYTITEEQLDAAGIEWRGASKASIYIKMTEGGADSMLNAQIKLGPDGADGLPVGKASSKYLIGENALSLYDKDGDAIQENLVGNAGTGNYKFPDTNLNKSMQDGSAWDDSYADEITITIRACTENTDCEFLGIIFNNGAAYPSGFTAPVVEGSDYDTPPVVETSKRELLKMTLDYCDEMDSTKYQEDSWADLQSELEKAQAVYDDQSASDSELTNARASLEKVKANMLFKDTGTEANPLPYRDLTDDEIVEEMGAGINLGNTMDGHINLTPNETSWQSVKTTKAYIKALHDAGYNTVRIPITWGNMIDDENGYAINDAWISRVQDIVDYCVSQDMYAIINVHHDGAEQEGWLRVAAEDIDSVYEKFECVWRNIAEYFKDYDEHLIFESMNEITCMEGDDKNSAEAIAYDTPIIVNLNQIFVNVVRSTGSNNAKRWLAVVSHYANGGTQSGFELAKDSYNDENRIMFALHVYKSSTNTTWTYNEVYEVVNSIRSAANKHDVPIILGEYGTRTYEQAGTETGYNDVARAYFSEIVHRACQTAGAVPIVWDQGYGSNGKYETGLYSYWDRAECEPLFKTIVDAMMRGTYLPNSSSNNSYNFRDVEEDPDITPITEMTLSDETVTLTLNENYTVTAQTAPSDSNDVVLWSTDDETVATVSQGKIRARGIGTTTVRAYTQNGEIEKTVTVNVSPKTGENQATAIVAEDSYNVVVGRYIYLDPSVEPAGADSQITYRSSDTDIITVNALGKVVAINSGSAEVTMTAASGVTKTVTINVLDSEALDRFDAALHILYNDSAKNYYGTELSEPVTITGDGQYTVSFDLNTQLSTAGKNAGITEINNLTSIYIKDYDVTTGYARKTPITAAEIRYDSVKVNGVELTINNSNFTSALNGDVFDSGNPVNAWGNSAVDEITVSDHTASFTTIDNPTSIEVTFTLRNVEFLQSETDTDNEAVEMTAVGDTTITLNSIGDTAELAVKLDPVNTDSLVTFVSDNPEVVAVDGTAMAADPATGEVRVTATAMSEGTAVITATTENGLEVEFTVIVSEDESSIADEDESSGESSDSDSSSPGTDSESSDSTTDSSSQDSDSDSSDSTTDSSSQDSDSDSSDSTTDSSSQDSESPVEDSDVDSGDSSADTSSDSQTSADTPEDSSDTPVDSSTGSDLGSNPSTGAQAILLTGILLSAAALTVVKKKK